MQNNSNIGGARSHVVMQTWPYRLWQEQAQRLYPGSPQRQRQALLTQLTLKMELTISPTQWLWCHEEAARLVECEVQP